MGNAYDNLVGISTPTPFFLYGETMKKLKVIEVRDDFYIPHTFGRDIVHKGDIIMYKIKRGKKR